MIYNLPLSLWKLNDQMCVHGLPEVADYKINLIFKKYYALNNIIIRYLPIMSSEQLVILHRGWLAAQSTQELRFLLLQFPIRF